jgi:two-component system, sensor histidine kinase and response regulator
MKQTGNDTLLIIDDMPHHLKLLQHYLQQYDFNIRLADSGSMAFEILSSGAFKPDLILLDAIMPEMDGYEVCRSLKSNPQTADIPVIFMTSLWEMNDKISAFSVGASDFLTKPFPPEELVARMSVHLELNRTKQRLTQEIVTRENNHQQLHTLGQELETVARLVGQHLQHKINALQPTLEKLSTIQATDRHKELKRVFQEFEAKVDDLSFISNSDSWKLEKQRLNMQEIISPVLSKLTAKYPHLKVTLPKTWLNAEAYILWIEKIWEMLLTFAIQQTGKNCQLYITNELIDSSVRFSVKNNGAALTKTQIAALLSNREQPNIGNDLFLVRYLVERCNGEFGIETKGLIGNIFYFILPASLDFGNTYNRYLSLAL